MNDKGEAAAKRPRYASELKVCHPYPELGGNEEDDVSHERNVQQIKKCLHDAKPNHESLKQLMIRTFGKRRNSIITDVKPVEQICSEYPLLQKANYVNMYCTIVYVQHFLGHFLFTNATLADLLHVGALFCCCLHRFHWNLI